MSNVKQIRGDLLEADVEVIVQQINCLCVKPHGLSAAISRRYPYANVYEKRRALGRRNLAISEDRGTPGGNWIKYYQMIQEFAKDAPYTVFIYKLP